MELKIIILLLYTCTLVENSAQDLKMGSCRILTQDPDKILHRILQDLI